MATSRTGQAGSFLFYASVVLVTAGTVAFGLDWTNAPMPPMAETEASVQAAKLAANIPPPRPFRAQAQVRSVYPARPLPQIAEATPNQPVIVGPQSEAPVAVPAAQSAQPKCDIAACSAAYKSFSAKDCTWQPFDGPRRLCDKGQPQPVDASADSSTAPAAETDAAGDQTAPKCNVDACKQAYFTFTASDCTYQPSNGPRKLCTK